MAVINMSCFPQPQFLPNYCRVPVLLSPIRAADNMSSLSEAVHMKELLLLSLSVCKCLYSAL